MLTFTIDQIIYIFNLTKFILRGTNYVLNVVTVLVFNRSSVVLRRHSKRVLLSYCVSCTMYIDRSVGESFIRYLQRWVNVGLMWLDRPSLPCSAWTRPAAAPPGVHLDEELPLCLWTREPTVSIEYPSK